MSIPLSVLLLVNERGHHLRQAIFSTSADLPDSSEPPNLLKAAISAEKFDHVISCMGEPLLVSAKRPTWAGAVGYLGVQLSPALGDKAKSMIMKQKTMKRRRD
jgi:hypothetical protein